MQFLGYVIFSQDIWIEDEKIKAVRNWPEPKSIQDIQVFIGFANFYRRFIQAFSRITALLTSMFNTTGSLDLAPRKLGAYEVVESIGKADDRNLSKKSKNVKFEIQTRIGAMEKPTFLILDAKKAFNQLRQVFTKAPILQHFNPKYYIRIKIDASGYAIEEV